MSLEISKLKNIYQRFIDVQKIAQSVTKAETVKMFENDKGYKAVSHDDVAKLLHMPLAECGIVLIPDVIEYTNTEFEKPNKYQKLTTWYRTDIKIKVKWVNADDPQDFFESTGAAFALDTSDKSFSKAYSLALKIVLLKVHLLESKDNEESRPFDNENDTSGNEVAKKPYTPPPRPENKPFIPKPKVEPKPIENFAPKKSPYNVFLDLVKELQLSPEEMPELIERIIGAPKNSKELTEDEIQIIINYLNFLK